MQLQIQRFVKHFYTIDLSRYHTLFLDVWCWGLKQSLDLPLKYKRALICGTFEFCPLPGYAMLMSPNQDETAVRGCHSTGNRLCTCIRFWPVNYRLHCFLVYWYFNITVDANLKKQNKTKPIWDIKYLLLWPKEGTWSPQKAALITPNKLKLSVRLHTCIHVHVRTTNSF